MTHVPSVTSLLDLLNKTPLIKWANKLGLQGIEVNAYQSIQKNIGTKKHSEIEDFLLNGVCLEDQEIQNKIELLFKDCQILSIEESFKNDMFKGRCDIRFVKNGIQYIGDFKKKFKRPYLEHYLQLTAYKMHFGCDKICVIDLNQYQLHELDLHHEEKYVQIIGNLVNIYNLKREII